VSADLFEWQARYYGQPPHVTGSKTSLAASDAIAPKMTELQQKVFEAIDGSGRWGMTDEEGVKATGMNPSTYRPRRIELEASGRIVASGTVRETRAGRRAIVWIVK